MPTPATTLSTTSTPAGNPSIANRHWCGAAFVLGNESGSQSARTSSGIQASVASMRGRSKLNSDKHGARKPDGEPTAFRVLTEVCRGQIPTRIAARKRNPLRVTFRSRLHKFPHSFALSGRPLARRAVRSVQGRRRSTMSRSTGVPYWERCVRWRPTSCSSRRDCFRPV